jgi:hypothetical protein
MIRPMIPVRDGILTRYRARLPCAQRLPHPTVADYVAGWRWGFVCGLCAGALLVGIIWGCHG